MRTFQRTELIGRLGHEPELRFTPEGQAVTHCSVATDRPAKTGEQAGADWHQVVCWGKTLPTLARTHPDRRSAGQLPGRHRPTPADQLLGARPPPHRGPLPPCPRALPFP